MVASPYRDCSCSALPWELAISSNTYTDADKPYFDATTSIFSYFASYLEAKKILSSWIYWIVINLFTIGLYHTKDLSFYSGLMVVYLGMSVVGYMKWKKEYQLQCSSELFLNLIVCQQAVLVQNRAHGVFGIFAEHGSIIKQPTGIPLPDYTMCFSVDKIN